MRPRRIDDQELVAALEKVFRTCGYEGSSLARIAEATGLEKASLYHRFPGGKEEMALSVAVKVSEKFNSNIIEVVHSEDKPANKVVRIQRFLLDFYEEGRLSCLLDALSLSNQNETLKAGLEGALKAWIEAFASLSEQLSETASEQFSAQSLKATGLPELQEQSKEPVKVLAKERALQSVVNIQGALVVSRVLGDNGAFLAAIGRIGTTLGQS